jgi:protein lysine acetyltransferase
VDFVLENGLDVTIRPIRPDDKELLVAGLRLLSPESQYKRFLSPKPHLTRAELRYLTEVDGVGHYALVAVERDTPRHLVGVGRFIRDPERPDTAEFAIVVGDHYQGQGAGRALGSLLVDAARDRGIRRFTARTLEENAPAQRLIAGIGEHLEYVHCGDGSREIVAELAA